MTYSNINSIINFDGNAKIIQYLWQIHETQSSVCTLKSRVKWIAFVIFVYLSLYKYWLPTESIAQPENVRQNLHTICDILLSVHRRFSTHLHRPTWMDPILIICVLSLRISKSVCKMLNHFHRSDKHWFCSLIKRISAWGKEEKKTQNFVSTLLSIVQFCE